MVQMSEEIQKFFDKAGLIVDNIEGLRFSYLATSVDDPTKWAYMPDNRVDRATDPWTDHNLRVRTSPGKIISRMFPDMRPERISELITLWKSGHYDKNDYYINIVDGDDISYWYYEGNYAETSGEDNLHKSCMRYADCELYFCIYTANPRQVGLCIMLDENDKLLARCIVWKGIKSYDRVYATKPENEAIVKETLNKMGYSNIYNTGIDETIKLDNYEFRHYPYMDTFKYLSDNCLSTKACDYGKKLENTDGSWEDIDAIEACAYCGDYVNADDNLHYVDGVGDCCDDCAVYSDYYGTYILDEDAIWSDTENSYILRSESVTTYNDEVILECHSIQLYNGDYAHHEDDNVIKLYDGCYAHEDDAIELYNGEYAHEDDTIELHNGEYALEYDRDIIKLHDGTYAHEDDTVILYNEQYALKRDVVKLHDEEYAHIDDKDLIKINSKYYIKNQECVSGVHGWITKIDAILNTQENYIDDYMLVQNGKWFEVEESALNIFQKGNKLDSLLDTKISMVIRGILW